MTSRKPRRPRPIRTQDQALAALRKLVGQEGYVAVTQRRYQSIDPGSRYESETWSGTATVQSGGEEVASAVVSDAKSPAELVAQLTRELQQDLMRRARARQFARAAIETRAAPRAIAATNRPVLRLTHVIAQGDGG